jgi:hypothetical protein
MDALLIPVFILFSLILPALAAALLLYAVPVRAAARLVHTEDRKDQIIMISWGIAAIRSSGTGDIRITEVLILDHAVISHAGPLEPGEEGSSAETVPELVHRPEGPVTIEELVHIIHRLIGPVGRFGSVFWQQSRFIDARGTVALGLGDPALTGEVCGYYWASRFILEAARVDIDLEPVFDRAVLELDITVRMRVEHPLRIVAAGIDLAFSTAMKDVMALLMRQDTGRTAA